MAELVEDERMEEEVGGRSRWLIALLGLMLRRPQDTVAAAMATAALITVLVNALFLQPNPHPAPLFSVRPKARPPAAYDSTGAVMVLPRPRPADLAAPPVEPVARPAPAGRSRSDIVTDIQRELARRSYYNGAIDGIFGSQTEAAIRALEGATGTTFGTEPNEPMLQAIQRAPAAARSGALRRGDPIGDLVTRTAAPVDVSSSEPFAVVTPVVPVTSSARFEARPEPGSAPAPTQAAARPTHQEPAMPAAVPANPEPAQPADRPAPRADLPSPQVKAVQRALSEFGYGQLQSTGVVDAATAAAIRDFEESRDLPITGQVNDRMVQELANVTGRAIE
ncbi:MAG: peptidoglycan-binding protein [Xanthobacteraceae bacterium]